MGVLTRKIRQHVCPQPGADTRQHIMISKIRAASPPAQIHT